MADQPGQKIRVVLRRIQLLESKEPFFKARGEYSFRARVSVEGGSASETILPEKGYYSLSAEPGKNIVPLQLTLYEGQPEGSLTVELNATELDKMSANDNFTPYRKTFSGAPDSWVGSYGPAGDEDLGDWRIWYLIERA